MRRLTSAMRSAAAAAATLFMVAALGGGAASAQDHIVPEQDPGSPGAADDAGGIMNRPLPFRDGQRLRYIAGDGTYQGYAERQRLTIRFYDADGKYLGRAQRVSQVRTDYYAPDGTFIGHRYHQVMTTRPVRNTGGDHGFDPG
ncbi:MAG TPA: hypothetical protein VGD08_15990 [Stellaceae bacterium]